MRELARVHDAALAKEASARRAGQYNKVRASAESAESCRQRREPAAELGCAARERRVVGVVSAEEKYVAGAYLVVFLVVLAYVLIMATKVARLEREVAELAELARSRAREAENRSSHELTEVEVG